MLKRVAAFVGALGLLAGALPFLTASPAQAAGVTAICAPQAGSLSVRVGDTIVIGVSGEGCVLEDTAGGGAVESQALGLFLAVAPGSSTVQAFTADDFGSYTNTWAVTVTAPAPSPSPTLTPPPVPTPTSSPTSSSDPTRTATSSATSASPTSTTTTVSTTPTDPPVPLTPNRPQAGQRFNAGDVLLGRGTEPGDVFFTNTDGNPLQLLSMSGDVGAVKVLDPGINYSTRPANWQRLGYGDTCWSYAGYTDVQGFVLPVATPPFATVPASWVLSAAILGTVTGNVTFLDPRPGDTVHAGGRDITTLTLCANAFPNALVSAAATRSLSGLKPADTHNHANPGKACAHVQGNHNGFTCAPLPVHTSQGQTSTFSGPLFTVCQATTDPERPYVRVPGVPLSQLPKVTSAGGVFPAEPWTSIVPPGPGYDGLNWSTAGQAIYNAGCVAPRPEPRITFCEAQTDPLQPYIKRTVPLSEVPSADSPAGIYPTRPWTSIVPPGQGHAGLNWSTQGQEIFERNCSVPQTEEQFTICEATGDPDQPYRKVTGVPRSEIPSAESPAYLFPKPKWTDIVPPFFGYDGLNWSEEGQAIYAQDCAVPKPNTTVTPEADPLLPICRATGLFESPYTFERIPASEILPSGGDRLYPTKGWTDILPPAKNLPNGQNWPAGKSLLFGVEPGKECVLETPVPQPKPIQVVTDPPTTDPTIAPLVPPIIVKPVPQPSFVAYGPINPWPPKQPLPLYSWTQGPTTPPTLSPTKPTSTPTPNPPSTSSTAVPTLEPTVPTTSKTATPDAIPTASSSTAAPTLEPTVPTTSKTATPDAIPTANSSTAVPTLEPTVPTTSKTAIPEASPSASTPLPSPSLSAPTATPTITVRPNPQATFVSVSPACTNAPCLLTPVLAPSRTWTTLINVSTEQGNATPSPTPTPSKSQSSGSTPSPTVSPDGGSGSVTFVLTNGPDTVTFTATIDELQAVTKPTGGGLTDGTGGTPDGKPSTGKGPTALANTGSPAGWLIFGGILLAGGALLMVPMARGRRARLGVIAVLTSTGVLLSTSSAWSVVSAERAFSVAQAQAAEQWSGAPEAIGRLSFGGALAPVYVFDGIDDSSLVRGPGWYPTSTPLGGHGNTAIAGHRTGYGSPFADLDSLRVGDPIVVETPQGDRRTYAVSDVRLVGPEDVWVVGPDPLGTGVSTLTLTTCDPPGINTKRLVVIASLRFGSSPA